MSSVDDRADGAPEPAREPSRTKLKVSAAGWVLIIIIIALASLGMLTHNQWLGFAGLIMVAVGFMVLSIFRDRLIRVERVEPPS
jgi:hypothetical protein